MGHPPLLPLVPFGLLILALLLHRLRTITCPPTCRRCMYDVSHRPAGVTLCSECGADLTKRRAILTRRRARLSPPTRWLAAFLLPITIAWPTNTWRKFDWRTSYLHTAPNRLIAFHAQRVTGPFAKDAFDEWLRRYRAGQLPPAARDRFFDYLLAWQGDSSRPWDPTMGDLLFDAFTVHHLSPDRADRFVNNTFVISTVRVRPSMHAGDPVPIDFTAVDRSPARSAFFFTFGVNASFRYQPQSSYSTLAPVNGAAAGGDGGEFTAEDAATNDLTPGPARLNLLFLRYLIDDRNFSVVHTAFTRQTVNVIILPPGAPLAKPVPNPAVADAVARSVSVAVRRWESGQLSAKISLTPAPVDRAFNVYVNPAHPVLVAERFAAANESCGPLDPRDYHDLLPIVVPKDQRSVQIQFVGSDSPLRHSVREKTYWPGTITYTVPIRESGDNDTATTSPTYTVTPATQ